MSKCSTKSGNPHIADCLSSENPHEQLADTAFCDSTVNKLMQKTDHLMFIVTIGAVNKKHKLTRYLLH